MNNTTRRPIPDNQMPSQPRTPVEPESDTAEKKAFLDLSLTQLLGGSLAAATAAALGSRLGVVGTIAGAALVSVISAVAASVYTHSLRRTRSSLVTAARYVGLRETSDGRIVAPTSGQDAAASGPVAASSGADSHASGQGADADESRDVAGGDSGDPRDRRAKPSRRTVVVRVALAALAVFFVAAVTITGLELVTGKSLSGSSDSTTVGDVGSRSERPAQQDEPAETPTPDAEATGDESAEPEPEPETPSETPEESATPTETPPTETPTDGSETTTDVPSPGAGPEGDPQAGAGEAELGGNEQTTP